MPVNVDPNEIKKFAAMSANWWDETGELRTLHEINPLRMRFITERVTLAGKKIADIGCGGGILSESLARAGANVTGIDMNEAIVKVAKLHLLESGLSVNYECLSAEALAEREPEQFDVITCLEMLEHVPDPSAIVQACATLLKPGGTVFFSTLNRTPKSYLFAIVGAEYILRLLPRNTHDYAKFIRPSELSAWCTQHKLTPNEIQGIAYNPLTKHFKVTTDVSINYFLCASKS